MKQPLEMTMYVEVDSGGNDLLKEGLQSKMLNVFCAFQIHRSRIDSRLLDFAKKSNM